MTDKKFVRGRGQISLAENGHVIFGVIGEECSVFCDLQPDEAEEMITAFRQTVALSKLVAMGVPIDTAIAVGRAVFDIDDEAIELPQ